MYDVFIASFQQVNDSVVAIAKNDNSEISVQTDFLIYEGTRLGIEEITETTTFKELDGVSLLLSGIFDYNDNKYLLFTGATYQRNVTVLLRFQPFFEFFEIFCAALFQSS